MGNLTPEPGGNDAGPRPVLEGSSRQVLKGTLVKLDLSTPPEVSGIVKYGVIQQLSLAPGEVDATRSYLRSAVAHGAAPEPLRLSNRTLDLLQQFEQPPIPALRPDIAAAASIPGQELDVFAHALVAARTATVEEYQTRQIDGGDIAELGASKAALNAAVIARAGLAANNAASPIGMLNLERIEMTPSGLQRGELIATIPLAPGEETAVTQKEWSVTSKEFTSIVTDSLENVSETGVTDNTELAQGTTSQAQHSNQLNITGTVQGGIPIISGSAQTGFTMQDADSASATASTKHATALTQKASARSLQEHKTTITTTTVTGSSETTTRTLKNTSSTDPIRIDYFSLMREWRVRLYRYGLRLTYDIVIPEPASAMRQEYRLLSNLRTQIGPFVFAVRHSDITAERVSIKTGQPTSNGAEPVVERYKWFEDQYQVSVPVYPIAPAPQSWSKMFDGAQEWTFNDLEFDVPDQAQIKGIYLDCNAQWDPSGGGMKLIIVGTQTWPFNSFPEAPPKQITQSHVLLVESSDATKPFLAGATGHQKVNIMANDCQNIEVRLTVEYDLLPNAVEEWRNSVWDALYNAAQASYYSKQQDIASQITDLEGKLTGVDTLTLRREESDEVMKAVLRWVLGSQFEFMPDDVDAAFVQALGKDSDAINYGVTLDGNSVGMSQQQFGLVRQYEDIVRFINEAIEWENVVTFLYSYFWDVPQSWAFIRQIRHPDADRQAFLRAGSARVVLTVRKGWEEKWIGFVNGSVQQPGSGPYLTIAQEIAAYDDHNYPGIPPANQGKAAARLEDSVYTSCAADVLPGHGPVTIEVADASGLVVGRRVVIDTADDRRVQESPFVTAVDPLANTVTLNQLEFAHTGTDIPFPVVQPGDKGTLIAEWNEYTPSSGTDIAVTSNLATIA